MIQHGDFYEQIWLVHSAKFLLEFLAHSAFMPSWIKSYVNVIGTKLLTVFFCFENSKYNSTIENYQWNYPR